MSRFEFDVKLLGSIMVEAGSRQEARRLLNDALHSAEVNAGAWPNGEPILFQVSQDGRADLVTIDDAIVAEGL